MMIVQRKTFAASHRDHHVLGIIPIVILATYRKLFKIAAMHQQRYISSRILCSFAAYFVSHKCFKLFLVTKFFLVMLFLVPVY